MVLVDTSVWIRMLAGREPYAGGMRELLARDETAAHELVYGELLMGDIGGHRRFLETYERMRRAIPVPHHEVVAFVRGRRLQGRGVGWIDAHLLASALASRMHFWTADVRLAGIAAELGVAYKE